MIGSFEGLRLREQEGPVELLPWEQIQGLGVIASIEPLAGHYELYRAYVNQFNASVPPPCPQAPPSRSFLEGAIVFHEAYFTGFGDDDVSTSPTGPAGPLKDALLDRFGPNWWDEMVNVAMCRRGWAILGFFEGHGLDIVGLDSQDPAPLAEMPYGFGAWEPVIAADLYEHAYWTDFTGAKRTYTAQLSEFIDWGAAGARYAAARGGAKPSR